MTLPLVAYTTTVGPFNKPIVTPDGRLNWFEVFYQKRSGFRQRKPYDVDTTYSFREYVLVSGYTQATAWSWDVNNGSEKIVAGNKARASLVNQLGDSSSFGATATAELRETWGMVVSTLTRLASAARDVKRLRFFSAAQTLGLPYTERSVTKYRTRTRWISRRNGQGRMRLKVRVSYTTTVCDWGTGRDHAKTLASGWLMYSYGVKPLAQDIHNGMETLVGPLPSKTIRGTGSKRGRSTYVDSYSNLTTYKVYASCKCQLDVRVSNPNVWLANKLGLVNPLQWVNEAIPFSFVLDWVSNLSQVIMQMTDFVGLETSKPVTTYKLQADEILSPRSRYTWPYHKKVVVVNRELTTPTAKLIFEYERFSWQRGLNAISLLVGFLPKK